MSRAPHYEPGRYKGFVKDWQLGKTRNGNPQFVLTFEVQGRINPSDPDGELLPTENYDRSIFRVITDKTIDYVMQDLEYLGYDRDTFAALDQKSEDPFDFYGLTIEVSCSHEEYEGVMRERWQINQTRGRVEVEPIDAKEVRKLDALYGKKLKERTATQEPETVPPSDEKPANDDIPF